MRLQNEAGQRHQIHARQYGRSVAGGPHRQRDFAFALQGAGQRVHKGIALSHQNHNIAGSIRRLLPFSMIDCLPTISPITWAMRAARMADGARSGMASKGAVQSFHIA